MKKLICSFVAILSSAMLRADTAAVEQVIVRQQWPWSTDIKVEYKLSGVDAEHPVNLGVRAFNGETEIEPALLAGAVRGNVYGLSESGVGELLIDPVAIFGEQSVKLNNFKVKLSLSDSDSNANEVVYKIFDLTAETGTFPCKDVTRADIINGRYGTFERNFSSLGEGFATSLSDVLIWTGVTNDVAYSTTHLVMRKIPAGSFTMGQTGIAEKPHEVTLTKDFWIGVFPLTQMQYKKLTRNASWPVSGESRPLGDGANYSTFQGVVTNAIASNLGVSVNYPSEAQWEYACRAGTTSELYTGFGLSSANLDPIAWHGGNSGNSAHDVGGKLPNAYGLYDMVGNVYEACRDGFKAVDSAIGYSDGAAVTNPEEDGPASGGDYVIRGGYFGLNNVLVTSAGRNKSSGYWTAYGFRLAFTVE